MNNKFNWKVFISFSLIFNFLLILISGVVLYVKPTGQDATWINWRLLGFSKTEWEAIHTIFSYVFAIFALAHLFFINWKAILFYLSEKIGGKMKRTKEIIFSVLTILAISFGTINQIPPFSSLMILGDHFSDSWTKEYQKIPFPRAERQSIGEIISKIDGIDTFSVKKKFEIAMVKYQSFNQSLSEIAELNSLSPAELYLIMIR